MSGVTPAKTEYGKLFVKYLDKRIEDSGIIHFKGELKTEVGENKLFNGKYVLRKEMDGDKVIYVFTTDIRVPQDNIESLKHNSIEGHPLYEGLKEMFPEPDSTPYGELFVKYLNRLIDNSPENIGIVKKMSGEIEDQHGFLKTFIPGTYSVVKGQYYTGENLYVFTLTVMEPTIEKKIREKQSGVQVYPIKILEKTLKAIKKPDPSNPYSLSNSLPSYEELERILPLSPSGTLTRKVNVTKNNHPLAGGARRSRRTHRRKSRKHRHTRRRR